MIIDNLANLWQYEGSFSRFKKVFDHVLSIDIKTLSEGKHQMPDDLGYIGIDKVMARPKEGAYPEAHRNYIDIQIPFNTVDTMGWKSVSDCKTIKIPYNAEKDIMFYSDEVDFYIPVKPGQFIISSPTTPILRLSAAALSTRPS